MAFATRLVAIERTLGKYSVHSQFEGGVPLDKLGPRERLSDVSTDPVYRDFAGGLRATDSEPRSSPPQ